MSQVEEVNNVKSEVKNAEIAAMKDCRLLVSFQV